MSVEFKERRRCSSQRLQIHRTITRVALLGSKPPDTLDIYVSRTCWWRHLISELLQMAPRGYPCRMQNSSTLSSQRNQINKITPDTQDNTRYTRQLLESHLLVASENYAESHHSLTCRFRRTVTNIGRTTNHAVAQNGTS